MTFHPHDPFAWRELLRQEIHLPQQVHDVPTAQCAGRILGGEVRSTEDLPAVPIAAMDGFAVRRTDLCAGMTLLPVSQEVPARPGAVTTLMPGTAARIMTGAPVPMGADAVIKVEQTDADPFGPPPAEVRIDVPELPPPGHHVRSPGEETARGQLLAAPGDRVTAGLVGMATTLGIARLPLRRPLRAAVVVTGDELVAQDGASGPAPERTAVSAGTVRESNSAMLTAALIQDGVEVTAHRSGDDLESLRRTLDDAAQGADLVLTTGGIGRGAFDVVKLLLGERGTGTSHFTHLALRPGAPQGWGRLAGGVPVLHLPGTPVGALVGYHLFVRPLWGGGALRPVHLPGADHEERSALRGRPGTVHAQPARLHWDEQGRMLAKLLPGRRLMPYSRAEAIVLRSVPDPADPAVNADDAKRSPQALAIQL